MKTRNSYNNTSVARSYKNTASSESINIKGIQAPFRVVNGQMVHATHDGQKWVW